MSMQSIIKGVVRDNIRSIMEEGSDHKKLSEDLESGLFGSVVQEGESDDITITESIEQRIIEEGASRTRTWTIENNGIVHIIVEDSKGAAGVTTIDEDHITATRVPNARHKVKELIDEGGTLQTNRRVLMSILRSRMNDIGRFLRRTILTKRGMFFIAVGVLSVVAIVIGFGNLTPTLLSIGTRLGLSDTFSSQSGEVVAEFEPTEVPTTP